MCIDFLIFCFYGFCVVSELQLIRMMIAIAEPTVYISYGGLETVIVTGVLWIACCICWGWRFVVWVGALEVCIDRVQASICWCPLQAVVTNLSG